MFVSVPAEARMRLWPLFATQKTLRAVTRGVVEGHVGEAAADEVARPRVARLDVGCYALFAGDASHPAARALALAVAAPIELVFGNDAGWRRLLQEVHKAAVDRPMRSFDPGGLDPNRLAALAASLPDGYTMAQLDGALASLLDHELEPHALQVYPSVDAFVRRGIGYGAVRDSQLVCAATSYTLSSRDFELAIATRPQARGLGLAAATSARLLLHAVQSGLVPHWNAANPVSQRLAERLGYRPGGLCEVLYLP